MPIKQSKIWKFFSSIKLAIWLLSTIAALSLVGTLIPQNEEPGFYLERYGHSGYQVLSKIGLTDIYASWWFILFLVLLSLNLLVCFLNRFSLKNRSWGTTISHFSVLVILSGALIGMLFGQKGMIKIGKAEVVNSFATQNKQVNLGFSIRLNEFIYTENISPKEKLLVYCNPKEDSCKLRNPATEVNNSNALIAEVPTEIGVESKIAETGYKIKVLRYLPDFVMDIATKTAASRSSAPNNPAIEAELKDKNGNVKTFWVFSRFADMHQETNADFKFIYNWVMRQPKDFLSKVTILKDGKEILNSNIRVNEPFYFGGYTFFQSSYDSENLAWSGLKVVKDPGVPVIYLGFVLLILGLVMVFYINPLKQAKESR